MFIGVMVAVGLDVVFVKFGLKKTKQVILFFKTSIVFVLTWNCILLTFTHICTTQVGSESTWLQVNELLSCCSSQGFSVSSGFSSRPHFQLSLFLNLNWLESGLCRCWSWLGIRFRLELSPGVCLSEHESFEDLLWNVLNWSQQKFITPLMSWNIKTQFLTFYPIVQPARSFIF